MKALSRELALEAQQAFVDCGQNEWAAGRRLGLSRSTYQHRLARGRQLYGDLVPIPPRPDPAVSLHTPETLREPLSSFEEAWAQWQRAIGMATDRYSGPRSETHRGGASKILVVPDLHAPFHERELFAEMVEREADADLVVGIGDMADSYALSRFVKYERASFTEEWAEVTLAVQELASRFPRVELVIGNHEARLERQLRERLTTDMVDAVRYLTGGPLCPLTALAKRYENVSIARHTTPDGQEIDWCVEVGDAWFGHPEKYSRVPGSAVRFTEEWLSDFETSYGFGRHRLMVMGHTHQFSMLPWRAGKLLVECGCLCKTQGYMLSSKIGGRPQRRGYLTLTQHDGVTDLNSVRWYGFDWR